MTVGKLPKSFPLLLLVMGMLFFSGCASWTSGWKQFQEPTLQGDVSGLFDNAEKLVATANSREELFELIGTYEKIIQIDPKNHRALECLGSYYFLLGYGYTEAKEERKGYLRKSIQYNEQRMYLNPDFAALVENDEEVWEASSALTQNEMEAIWWWYLSFGVYWKECFSFPEKVLHVHWPFRGKKILKRMMEIDPTWQNGSPYYCQANYYAVVPGFLGGDMAKAKEYYQKAIELGPNMLNFRRTRAKLFHTKNQDRDAFINDLQWVVAQDPHTTAGLTYPWNAFIQRDAQEGLDNIDQYFGE